MLNRSTEAGSSTPKSQGSSGLQAPLLGLPQGLPPVPPMAVIPQQLITAGTRKDCIRLRGLPYESQVRLLPVLISIHNPDSGQEVSEKGVKPCLLYF